MTDEELLALLPEKSPADALAWLHRKGKLNQSYLVYRFGRKTKEGGKADVYCTACGQHFELDWAPPAKCSCYSMSTTGGVLYNDKNHPRHTGSAGWCTCCRREGKLIHVSYAGTGGYKSMWFMTVEKRGRAAVLCAHRAVRYLDRELRVQETVEPLEAYIFAPGERGRIQAVRAVHREMWFSTETHLDHWKLRKRCTDEMSALELVYPWRARDLCGTVLENAKLKEYCRATEKTWNMPVSYLREYCRHQAVENLVTAGFGKLVCRYLRDGSWEKYKGAIDWKEKQPAKMLRVNRRELRMLGPELDLDGLTEYQRSRDAMGRPLKAEEWADIKAMGVHGYDNQIYTAFGTDLLRAARYLKRQQMKNRNVSYRELRDYWKFLKRLGSDPEDPQLRWPKDLTAAHNRAADQVQQMKDNQKAEAFRRVWERLAPLCWEADGLCIRPAASAGELRQEGKALHHCVGGYADQHLRGESIFFVRRADAPDTPYFTLQLDTERGLVMQNRGLHNCARTLEVRAFEARWLAEVVLPWLKRARKKKNQKKMAVQAARGVA